MKINVDVDITPEEMRKLMGLPNVDDFHQQILDDIRERMREGAEDYDPLKLFQPYVASGLAGMDMMQKLFSAGLSASESRKDSDKD